MNKLVTRWEKSISVTGNLNIEKLRCLFVAKEENFHILFFYFNYLFSFSKNSQLCITYQSPLVNMNMKI